MDITLTIYANPPAINEGLEQAHTFYRLGDFIHVDHYIGGAPENARFSFLHVTDIPEIDPPEIMVKRIKQLIEQQISFFDVDQSILLRKRKWRVSVPRLTGRQYTDLIDNKELTLAWNKAKKLLRTKTIHDATDQTLDTDEVDMTEDDL